MPRSGSDEFVIVQMSDLHCGESRFDDELMRRVIDRTNELDPDAVFIVGDLTADGYRDQFDEASAWLDRIECETRMVIPGNHDSRHVGYLYFTQAFGDRFQVHDLPFGVGGQRMMRVAAADATIPDLNDGELGREHYRWLAESLDVDDGTFKVFLVHHHLVPIPGTGRERNIVWDAGDVLEILDEAGVDLVLSGHKHVPYAWPIAGMLAISSGTATTWRTRGVSPPSTNVIRIRPEEIEVEIRHSADDGGRSLIFPRRPAQDERARSRKRRIESPDPRHIGVGASV